VRGGREKGKWLGEVGGERVHVQVVAVDGHHCVLCPVNSAQKKAISFRTTVSSACSVRWMLLLLETSNSELPVLCR